MARRMQPEGLRASVRGEASGGLARPFRAGSGAVAGESAARAGGAACGSAAGGWRGEEGGAVGGAEVPGEAGEPAGDEPERGEEFDEGGAGVMVAAVEVDGAAAGDVDEAVAGAAPGVGDADDVGARVEEPLIGVAASDFVLGEAVDLDEGAALPGDGVGWADVAHADAAALVEVEGGGDGGGAAARGGQRGVLPWKGGGGVAAFSGFALGRRRRLRRQDAGWRTFRPGEDARAKVDHSGGRRRSASGWRGSPGWRSSAWREWPSRAPGSGLGGAAGGGGRLRGVWLGVGVSEGFGVAAAFGFEECGEVPVEVAGVENPVRVGFRGVLEGEEEVGALVPVAPEMFAAGDRHGAEELADLALDGEEGAGGGGDAGEVVGVVLVAVDEEPAGRARIRARWRASGVARRWRDGCQTKGAHDGATENDVRDVAVCRVDAGCRIVWSSRCPARSDGRWVVGTPTSGIYATDRSGKPRPGELRRKRR